MKKVLIISYYWPPSGGIGVQRCLKFAKYLPKFGWESIVYAPENAEYAYKDESYFKDISEDLIVIKRPIKEPFTLFKLISGRKKDDPSNPVYARTKKVSLIDNLAIWIRGNFFIPDARFLWIKPSIKYLKKYLKDNPVDAILTDGPPHTNTVIGCKLSKELNIPWLADFQDPWTQVDYYKMMKISKWADKKHKKLEQEVFKVAKKFTIASPTWARDLESIGAKNVDPIFWGYDEDDFKNIPINDTKEFSISHAGLLGFDRNPETLFHVLSDLKTELDNFSNDLKIKFAGTVDYSVKESMKRFNLEENFQEIGTIGRPEALELISNAQVLLLPLNKAHNALGRIPGKLFECMRTHRPIICLGPNGSDVENILLSTKSGISFEYDNYQEIKKYIKDKYKDFQNLNLKNESKNIELYSVEEQVKKIASYLNKIIVLDG